MRYGSVCSGIEAATTAWKPLGWKAQFFSEIEPFPCSVLAHHYPNVPNYGDMTKYKEWPDAAIDVLVGGTPCQSYSVAGLRKGLDDPRGNLMLTYVAIARKYRSRWVVWENVPGVFSSNEGRDFGSLLGLLTGRHIECPPTGWQNSGVIPGYANAYGIAWRVLDAQFAGVPQRRRRVFVVGYLGDWRRAAAVFLERHSLQGHSAPSRKAGKVFTRGIEASTCSGHGYWNDAGGLAATIRAQDSVTKADTLVLQPIGIDEECNATIDGFGPLLRGGQGGTRQAVATFDRQSSGEYGTNPVASTVSARDYKSAADLVVAFAQNTRDEVRLMGGDGQIAGALAAEPGMKQQTYVAFRTNQTGAQGPIHNMDTFDTLAIDHPPAIAYQTAVRRLTPRECERLQGFPDDYTLVPHRGKTAADGSRYKAIGNSMNTDCMRWIGERIAMVDAL